MSLASIHYYKMGPTIHSRFESTRKSPTRWAVARSSGVGMLKIGSSNQSGCNQDWLWIKYTFDLLGNKKIIEIFKNRGFRSQNC